MTSFSMRAVGYRRVSMREQVDGFSLDAQENNIRKLAVERGWDLIKIYTDAGISAKKDSRRPELVKLMQDAEDGHFDVIIVDKIDRFYRHLNGLLNALDQLNGHNVTFISVQERLDFTTPWGKLTLTMLGMLAEIYIDNLRQETRKGKMQRARDGLWNGNIPYGYCRGLCSNCTDPNGPGYCPDVGLPDKNNGKTMIEHPIDGNGVRMMFDFYLNGIKSDLGVAEKMNQMTFTLSDGTVRNYRQKGIHGRKGPGLFTKDFVRGVVTRILYTGKIAYYGRGRKRKIEALYPGKHPALISDETFQALMDLRKTMGTVSNKKQNTVQRVYPLTGILFCAGCGWPMRGSIWGRLGFAYKDSSRVDVSNDHCDQMVIKATTLEKQVIKLLSGAAKAWEKSVKPDAINKHANDAQTDLQRAQELYIRGEITKEILEREKERVENIINPLQENNFTATLTVSKKVQEAYTNWTKLSTIEQKRLLRGSVEAIFVRENALVALQPTFAFLPILATLFEKKSSSSGPDGRHAHSEVI
jgi:site-specific DNA recombinase